MDVPMTKEQADQLISELKRFNDILLAFVQRQGGDFAPKYPAQELPKPRDPETGIPSQSVPK
jgi:hypothetical protein